MTERSTRGSTKTESSPQSSNKSILDEIRRLKSEIITKKDLEGIVKKILDEKTKVIQESIDENTQSLRALHRKVDSQNEIIENLQQKVSELEENIEDSKRYAITAYLIANRNEQYSRKNTFKINGIKETQRENTKEVVKRVLEKEGVKLDEADVIAIHRIPGKAGEPKPILVKLKNNMAKSSVMRKRSAVKKNSNGHCWLSDDVTKLNGQLIKKLKEHPQIDNAWYFNGSVYGEKDGIRMKFDLLDNIDEKIRKRKK